MHALVATSGTVGELYPLLSVAVELQKRKYVVSFAAQAYHKQKVEDAGIAFHALRPDVHQNTLEYMFSNTQEINSRVLSFHTSAIPETFEDLLLCSQGVDIIVSGALVFPPARLIAHMKGIPWINCVIYPDAVKPPPTTELLRYLAGGQLSSQDRTQFIKAAGRALHALCSTYHIAPPAMFSRPAATLALFSPCLINSEISDLVQIIGFPKYHGAISELPGELVGFLKAGTPPIVFALGTSAIHAVGPRFYEIAISAAVQLGFRAVLLTGLDERVIPQNIPGDGSVFVTGQYVNYLALFQNAKLVAHHGGIGTMAAAMRAGVPALIIPFAFDQPQNAVIAQGLGIARALAPQDYGLDKLTSELLILSQEPSYATRSTELSSVVQKEDGAERACQIIEQFLLPARRQRDAAASNAEVLTNILDRPRRRDA